MSVFCLSFKNVETIKYTWRHELYVAISFTPWHDSPRVDEISLNWIK